MAHKCPRCGGPVSRGYSESAQKNAGLVGVLFYAAFGAFECKKCGKIPGKEFPTEVRSRMTILSLLFVLGALAVIALGIWLLSIM